MMRLKAAPKRPRKAQLPKVWEESHNERADTSTPAGSRAAGVHAACQSGDCTPRAAPVEGADLLYFQCISCPTYYLVVVIDVTVFPLLDP